MEPFSSEMFLERITSATTLMTLGLEMLAFVSISSGERLGEVDKLVEGSEITRAFRAAEGLERSNGLERLGVLML